MEAPARPQAPPPRRGRLRRVPAWLVLAVPAAALAAALAVTSGSLAVPPLWPVPAATVVVFAILTAAGGPRPRPWIDLPFAAALGVAAGHILLAPGLPRGHDTATHLWGIWAIAREVAAGDLWPGWVHGIGPGLPLLHFYGSVSFLAPVLLTRAGAAPAEALPLTLALLGALAAAAMYAAAARWTGDRRAALVAAAAYAFAPYRLLVSNYRAALGEATALALLPLVFGCALAAARRGGRRTVALAAALCALLLATHPLSAAMTAAGTFLWAGVDLLVRPEAGVRRLSSLVRGTGRLAAAWTLGACLAGFFTLPLAVELREVEVAEVARGEQRLLFTSHGLTPAQPWRRSLWSDLLTSEMAGTAADGLGEEMPFYFGLVLAALSAVALARRPRATAGPAACLVLLLILTLRQPAAIASLLLPPLAVLQFPWRLLGPATFAAAAAAGFATAGLLAACGERRRLAALVPGVLAALLLLDAAPYTGAAAWIPPYEGLVRLRWARGEPWHPEGPATLEEVPRPYPARVAGYFLPPPAPEDVALFCCAYPEYVTPEVRRSFFPPRDPAVLARAGVGLAAWETGPQARLDPRPYAFWRPPGGGRLHARPSRRGTGEIVVEHDGRPGTITVLEQDFPGWQVATPDGWRDAQATTAGLLRAEVAPGQRRVRFRFATTRGQVAGGVLSAVTLFGVGAALAARPRRRRH